MKAFQQEQKRKRLQKRRRRRKLHRCRRRRRTCYVHDEEIGAKDVRCKSERLQ